MHIRRLATLVMIAALVSACDDGGHELPGLGGAPDGTVDPNIVSPSFTVATSTTVPASTINVPTTPPWTNGEPEQVEVEVVQAAPETSVTPVTARRRRTPTTTPVAAPRATQAPPRATMDPPPPPAPPQPPPGPDPAPQAPPFRPPDPPAAEPARPESEPEPAPVTEPEGPETTEGHQGAEEAPVTTDG